MHPEKEWGTPRNSVRLGIMSIKNTVRKSEGVPASTCKVAKHNSYFRYNS